MPTDYQPPKSEGCPDPGIAPRVQEFARDLDLRHVKRPLPLVVIARELSKMNAGEQLRVLLNAQDGVASDVWALVRSGRGYELVSHQVTEEGHVHVFSRSGQ